MGSAKGIYTMVTFHFSKLVCGKNKVWTSSRGRILLYSASGSKNAYMSNHVSLGNEKGSWLIAKHILHASINKCSSLTQRKMRLQKGMAWWKL